MPKHWSCCKTVKIRNEVSNMEREVKCPRAAPFYDQDSENFYCPSHLADDFVFNLRSNKWVRKETLQ